MYEVVRSFIDRTNGHLYKIGDVYPISGDKPTKGRIDELAKGKNEFGSVFIKKADSDANKAKEQDIVEDHDPS